MRKRIGDFYVEKGLLTPEQVERIAQYGRERGLKFGNAGLALELLKVEQLVELFGRNYNVDFFNLDPAYFPEATRELMPPSDLIRLGALPLGFKSRFRFFRRIKSLNVGLLDPVRKDAEDEFAKRAREKFSATEVNVYLITADQFIAILEQHYGVGPAELLSISLSEDPSRMDPTLRDYLRQTRPRA